MLHIQKRLLKDGLEKTITDLKLKMRDYPHKVVLKYDQLNSDYNFPEVRECRGLVLAKGTWEFMSTTFYKFFNLEEGMAAPIDWSTARVFSKADGTCCSLYWDWIKGSWEVNTTGTAEAEGEITQLSPFASYAQLFWYTFNLYSNVLQLNKEFVYTFELMTPDNIVVVPHTVYKLELLTIRHRPSLLSTYPNDLTLGEITYDNLIYISKFIGIPLVKSWELNDLDSLKNEILKMEWDEEGFVVIDNRGHRVKVKNPKYVIQHHSIDLSDKSIIKVIMNNELDEVCAVMTNTRFIARVNQVKEAWVILAKEIEASWDQVVPEFLTTNNVTVDQVLNDRQIRREFSFYLTEKKIEWNGYIWNRLSNPDLNIHDFMSKENLGKIMKKIRNYAK